MSDYTKLFERASARIQTPALPLEGMLRRRDRKRRNQRLVAGVVGIAVAVVAIAAGTSIIRSSPKLPATPPQVHNGDITFVTGGGIAGVSASGTQDPLVLQCCNPSGGWIQGADWSPDGSRFAYGISSRQHEGIPMGVHVFEVGTGETRRLSHASVQSIDWSPDGSKIAYSDFSAINIVAADGSDRTTMWPEGGDGTVADPSWSANGTKIAYTVYGRSNGRGSLQGAVHVVDVFGRTDRVIATAMDGPLKSPAWSPDGSKIAFIDGCGIWEVSSSGSGRTLLTHIDDCRALGTDVGDAGFSDAAQLVWSPDGTQLAFNLQGGAASFPLYLMQADGTRLRALPVPPGAAPPIAWQPVP
jgi:dipeptidyl aminopeptidase/acylaminoacyl peptidase